MDDSFVSEDEDKIVRALPQGSDISTSLKNRTMGNNKHDDFAVIADLEKEDMEGIDTTESDLKDNCYFCGKQVEHLDKHMVTNHGEKVECQLCSQPFSLDSLRSHILKEHCHNKVIKCSLCKQNFANKNDIENHIKPIQNSKTTPFWTGVTTSKCSICHKEYKDLYHHVRYVHNKIKNYKCDYCEKAFQAKGLMKNHMASIHLGEKTKCPICKKDFSVDNLNRHVREFHEKNRKQCPHCEKRMGMSNLSKHIRSVHNTNNTSTGCPDCGKAIARVNLTRHIDEVHKKRKKTCVICNTDVPSSKISLHKRRVHNIGKSIDDITPRGPNPKVRKGSQQIKNQGEDFYQLAGEIRVEDIYHEEADDGISNRTLQIGENNFTLSVV